jgi:hypothetical protein
MHADGAVVRGHHRRVMMIDCCEDKVSPRSKKSRLDHEATAGSRVDERRLVMSMW